MPEHPEHTVIPAGRNERLPAGRGDHAVPPAEDDDRAALLTGGDEDLPPIGHLLSPARRAVGAPGMFFVAHGAGGPRIVAVSGTAGWLLGRPVAPGDPTVASGGAGPAVRSLGSDATAGPLARELAARGFTSAVVAPVATDHLFLGSLYALYPEDVPPADAGSVAMLGCLATGIAHSYGHRCRTAPSAGGPGPASTEEPADDRELFVAVTSHELRTPVTVIKGYADTLSQHWDSLTEADHRKAARVIGQRADDLARLVDRLLASVGAGGSADGVPVPFDLVEALRTAVADLPADLRRRLFLDLPPGLPGALGDRLAVATVVTELVTNASKYSPPESPVEITAAADDRTVSFRVSDRGIGIRPDQTERAFERFWQGESGDRRRYPGAGLGLYLVRRVVERQNGWVSLRPRPGGGTVAEVRLPRG